MLTESHLEATQATQTGEPRTDQTAFAAGPAISSRPSRVQRKTLFGMTFPSDLPFAEAA